MRDVAIVYFSGTGNTAFVARAFAQAFEERGMEVDLLSIDEHDGLDADYRRYIFGCPTHAEAFPNYFSAWVARAAPIVDDVPCGVFTSLGARRSAAPGLLAQTLRERGYRVEMQAFFTMPDNFYMVLPWIAPAPEGHAEARERVRTKAERVVQDWLQGHPPYERAWKLRVKVGAFFYRFCNDHLRPRVVRGYTVDKEECILCGTCEQVCPTGSVTLVDDEVVIDPDTCILCQRCMMRCPTNAFRWQGKRYPQYDLQGDDG